MNLNLTSLLKKKSPPDTLLLTLDFYIPDKETCLPLYSIIVDHGLAGLIIDIKHYHETTTEPYLNNTWFHKQKQTLSIDKQFEYLSTIKNFKHSFDEIVLRIIHDYNEIRQPDWPTENRIKSMFKFDLQFL